MAAPDARPGAPDVAAAPAEPVTPAAFPPPAVTGAFTTTTEVEVSTFPLGRVVKYRCVDVDGVKLTPSELEVSVTRPPPYVLKITAPLVVATGVAELGVVGATRIVVGGGTVDA